MKFLPKINLKLKNFRKVIRTATHILRKHEHDNGGNGNGNGNGDSNSGRRRNANSASSMAMMDAMTARKRQIMSRTCTDYLMQIELHMQLQVPPKFLAKSTKENFMYDGTFHHAIGKVFLFAELFAFMPVKGVTLPHPSQLSFSWMNVRTWYTVFFILLSLFDMAVAMCTVLMQPITFNNVEPLIFRSSIIAVYVSALKLARKWPDLMRHWWNVERDLPPYYTHSEKSRLAHKIKIVTLVAMMLSLGEHLMNITANIHYSIKCPYTEDPVKNFFLVANMEFFYAFSYTPWLACLAKFENTLQTFVWNYMDVFVMIISIGLASKFEQLNEHLLKFKGMEMPEIFWMNSRIQYRQLCSLCERVDNAISLITVVSFSNNLYFICVQLLKSLNKMPSLAHTVYFYYSLLFLIGRTLAVSLYSSNINDESLKPLRVIRCIPKESWCSEVKRFAEDISSDVVALSGMKFFHITRSLVLSVAGTIVTYELVLIQFHKKTEAGLCGEDTHLDS